MNREEQPRDRTMLPPLDPPFRGTNEVAYKDAKAKKSRSEQRTSVTRGS